MKIPVPHFLFSGRAVSPSAFAARQSAATARRRLTAAVGAQGTARPTRHAGFTLVEIAICLAIIGIALVAIIGVLPMGMRTQRDNREETIMNQDATVFLEAIRGGARGLNDLTNYVYAITNYWTRYNSGGGVMAGGGSINNGYTYSSFSVAPGYVPPPAGYSGPNGSPINSGTNIIGLLSAPEFTDFNGSPTNNLFSGGYSNHVVAYVRSVSGPAVEKPPQDNDILRSDSFSYRILCVNAPVAMDTNVFGLIGNNISQQSPYTIQLAASLRDLRLTFLWPQLPNGTLGAGRQTFRTLVAGQLTQVFTNRQWLYFYEPQSFTNVVSVHEP
jgi:prepilin-type N-terminal cleavage/methylation domain-containing protein